MTITVHDVMRYYLDNIGREYGIRGVRWVLSTETAKAISKLAAGSEGENWRIEDFILCGIPIRIDDSVQSLSHEMIL